MNYDRIRMWMRQNEKQNLIQCWSTLQNEQFLTLAISSHVHYEDDDVNNSDEQEDKVIYFYFAYFADCLLSWWR